MADSCYLCRRTQADLDHLNEETRARVYLSYFSNARSQLDERLQHINFLQRLKDEESGDPHFRINADQVFRDPEAYEKLMPWIDTLIGIARTRPLPEDPSRTMGDLVEELLKDQREDVARKEHAMSQLRAAFATNPRNPILLEPETVAVPVDWPVERESFVWSPGRSGESEPLHRTADGRTLTVGVSVHLCSICRTLLGRIPP